MRIGTNWAENLSVGGGGGCAEEDGTLVKAVESVKVAESDEAVEVVLVSRRVGFESDDEDDEEDDTADDDGVDGDSGCDCDDIVDASYCEVEVGGGIGFEL